MLMEGCGWAPSVRLGGVQPRQPSAQKGVLQKVNFLFSGDGKRDAINICHYIDEYYAALGISYAEVDLSKMMGVVSGMVQGFPSPLGVEKSSPFKKAAAFTAYFAAERPLLTALPEAVFGSLHSHHNAIIAFELSVDALEGAQLHQHDGQIVTLKNRIKTSKHFWSETIAAISDCMPVHHFRCLALIYESLAYQENPDAAYPRS
jgi:hypothetical protein